MSDICCHRWRQCECVHVLGSYPSLLYTCTKTHGDISSSSHLCGLQLGANMPSSVGRYTDTNTHLRPLSVTQMYKAVTRRDRAPQHTGAQTRIPQVTPELHTGLCTHTYIQETEATSHIGKKSWIKSNNTQQPRSPGSARNLPVRPSVSSSVKWGQQASPCWPLELLGGIKQNTK